MPEAAPAIVDRWQDGEQSSVLAYLPDTREAWIDPASLYDAEAQVEERAEAVADDLDGLSSAVDTLVIFPDVSLSGQSSALLVHHRWRSSVGRICKSK